MIRRRDSMRPIFLLLLVANLAHADGRPLYGGALRLAVLGAFSSLDPKADEPLAAQRLKAELLPSVYECLTTIAPDGSLRPELALSWQHEADTRRWRFQLRPQVKLHNGQELSSQAIATSMQRQFPRWRVTAANDQLLIRTEEPHPELPTELSAIETAIVVSESDNAPVGTGPFQVKGWQSGKGLTLSAFEDHWQGRPFLDTVEVRFNMPARMSLLQLQAGSLDAAEVSLADAHSRELRTSVLVATAPLELLLLRKPANVPVSPDRRAIHRGLLQSQGEPAWSLLPQWLSGYAFLFSADHGSASRASQPLPPQTLAYENDGISALVAQRIAFDARESGVTLQPIENAPGAALNLVRVPLAGAACGASLAALGPRLGLRIAEELSTSQACYEREAALLDSGTLVPVAHLPELFALSRKVQEWHIGSRTVALPLAEVWLEPNPR